jgi:pyruvate-formate lyase-activating enzyme
MHTKDVLALLELPFTELVFRAQAVHREHHDPAAVQLSSLLSIKTGGCPEDCAYCPQSRRYPTAVEDAPLMAVGDVLEAARQAKAQGATRFCMGAAWRSPKDRQLAQVEHLVSEVKKLGLETCATLGMLKPGQAERLRAAGLDYYNHNLDTSPEFYGTIITTRDYDDRLETLARVREAGINVCCGGIVGMGESRRDRAALIALEPRPVSGERAHQRPRGGGGHAARGRAAARRARIRAHRGCGAHRDAQGMDPALGRPQPHERRGAGALFPGRREFRVLRRAAAHHRKPGGAARPRAFRPSRAQSRHSLEEEKR